MPISINGSGTITGVSVGGLPDGIVDTDMLATDAVSAAKLAAGAGGKFESVAVICDIKSASTSAGTFTAGSHVQRDLNTELIDPDGIVSIASNQFTLAAGNYVIIWKCPAFRVGRHTSGLRDMTADPNVRYEGTTAHSNSSSGAQTDSWGFRRVTPTSSNTYQIRHRCETTKNTEGLGISGSFVNQSLYTVVWILKEV